MEKEIDIKSKIEAVENSITGLWVDRANMKTWDFLNIEPDERIGVVFIYTTGDIPKSGVRWDYQIIWVAENMIYLDLIMPSINRKTQHHIQLANNLLTIADVEGLNQQLYIAELSRP